MIAVHPGGTLFVSGYGSQVTGTDWTRPPPLWRSEDDGQSWQKLSVGRSADGAQGNSDVDLAIAPDGTLYLVSMGFNRATGEGTQIAIGVSRDRGDSWRWQFLSRDRFDDRPWVAVGSESRVHVVWNDGGVRHTISDDAGATWIEQQRISLKGGSSHLAAGPDGRVAVRISAMSASGKKLDPDADAIAVSSDNGESWAIRAVPGNVQWGTTSPGPEGIPRWVEPLAWSIDGTLHHLWSEGANIRHGRSTDRGETWQVRDVANETGLAFFPYLVSDDDRRLVATWFVRNGDALAARVAVIESTADDAGANVRLSELFTPLAWEEGREHVTPSTAGEYLAAAFLRDGDIAVVSPIQDIHNDRWGFTFWRFGED